MNAFIRPSPADRDWSALSDRTDTLDPFEMDGATERFLNDQPDPFRFAEINRYWNDPAYAAAMDAERDTERAKVHAHFDAVRDRDLIRLGYIDAPASQQEAR